MDFIVKNTTKYNIMDLLCPYSCQGCGILGSSLCDCCKKNIITKQKRNLDLRKYIHPDWLKQYDFPFSQGWTCGWRDEILGQLVEDYKFKARRANRGVIVDIINALLPEIQEPVIIVPLPTIRRHIRERGFDHTWCVAKALAKRRGWECQRLLERSSQSIQVGSSAQERQIQAQEAYELCREVPKKRQYLLLDDVWTTGASLCAAASLLQEVGVEKIYGLAIVVSR